MSKWAVVTGASSGIGRAIAKQLAAEGMNLVLTARRADRLHELADALPVEVDCIALDLEERTAPRRLFEFTEGAGIQADLLVNNAGFGGYGEFRDLDPDRQYAMVQVNCAAVMMLTRLYLPGMIARKSGEILIVASTAAFQGLAYQATYGATKAFDLMFAEGIAEEVKRFGIRVCAVCPGMTSSEFHEVASEPVPKGMPVQPAEEVARIGLKALRAGRHHVICGFGNRVGVEGQRMIPRSWASAIAERLFRPPGA
jgi:short-subunit dehydrogenase